MHGQITGHWKRVLTGVVLGNNAPWALISAALSLLRHEVMQARATRPSLSPSVQCTLLLHLQTFWGQPKKNIASHTKLLKVEIKKKQKILILCLDVSWWIVKERIEKFFSIELSKMTLLSMSSRSSMDRAPARCSGGYGFDSCRGLSFFLSHARVMLINSSFKVIVIKLEPYW